MLTKYSSHFLTKAKQDATCESSSHKGIFTCKAIYINKTLSDYSLVNVGTVDNKVGELKSQMG